MEIKQHWDEIYQKKQAHEVSWFQPRLEQSLAFIERAGISKETPILDVGGGASTLADDLTMRGFTHLSILDISDEAHSTPFATVQNFTCCLFQRVLSKG
jgi:hypothetical protein